MSSSGFKDHFSGIADAYAQARPEYPGELFDLIAAHVPRKAHVWEPGCGSGQGTRGLAARFAHVHATDPSAQQIAQHWANDLAPDVVVPSLLGRPLPSSEKRSEQARNYEGDDLEDRSEQARNYEGDDLEDRSEHRNYGSVVVAVEPAERTSLPNESVQLIAVAQALHWFDRTAFFRECKRVLQPGGILAAWGYADFLPPEGMLETVAAFRAQIEPHWPPERALIDAHYAGFDWPFPACSAWELWLEAEWSLSRLLRYLASMSASARCLAETGDDPVARHAPALAAAWGDPDDVRTIQWPLFLHLRRKPALL